MAAQAIRHVHYLNQFFAGLGGEEQADLPPRAIEAAVGPGKVLSGILAGQGSVVATVVCGDDAFNREPGAAVEALLPMVAAEGPDVFVAGPAFGSGRYGVACATLGKAVTRRLGIPVLSGMEPDNPGVRLGRPELYVVPTTTTGLGMRRALEAIAQLALRLARGEEVGPPAAEGYLPRGVRVNVLLDRTGADRAVDLLLARLRGEPWETELAGPDLERIDPAPALADPRRARVALVCEGGVVPKGNPDRFESRRATKWARYSIAGLDDLTPESWECIHGGFDTREANRDPDRVVPLDAVRALEADGLLGTLHNDYIATVGVGTSVETAQQFGREIATELRSARVDGALMVAT